MKPPITYLSRKIGRALWGMAALVGLIWSTPSQAEMKAVWSTSRYDADMLIRIVEDRDALKWYFGKCTGDIVIRARRTKLYLVDYSGPEVLNVRQVAEKHRADQIVCLK